MNIIFVSVVRLWELKNIMQVIAAIAGINIYVWSEINHISGTGTDTGPKIRYMTKEKIRLAVKVIIKNVNVSFFSCLLFIIISVTK